MCSHTPRFSYRCPETRVPAVSVHASDVHGRVGAGRVGIGDGYTGGYTGRVIPGPSTDPLCSRREAVTAERAPEAPTGAGVGGHCWTDVPAAGRAPVPTPPGPGRPAGSLVQDPSECRLLANIGEIPVISL